MGQDEQTAKLIDVIYRDPNRIPSLSAQLFGGHLVSAENTSVERKAKDVGGSGGFNLGVLKGEGNAKRASEQTTSAKQVLQPHDVTAIDVIAGLKGRKQLDGGYRQASNGAVVRAVGTLTFFDPTLIKVVSAVYGDQPGKSKADRDTAKNVAKLMGSMTFPPIFYLLDGDTTLVGTLHESGLSDPIGSFNMRHGQDGMPNVTVVGIKESPRSVGLATDSLPLLGMMAKANQALAEIFLPATCVRISPICIYRELAE